MNRFLVTARWDVALQVRNGFYAATAFVAAFWALIFTHLPPLDLTWLLPPMVLGNALLGTFYFIGGLVLLEKAEGTLAAQVVTPLRIGEYLAAKVVTLTALAAVETVLLIALLVGGRFAVLPLVMAVSVAGMLYCLAGFVTVAPYSAINEYLLPSGLYAALLWIPLLAYMAQWHHPLLYLHQLQAPLVLAEAAFAPVSAWELAYGVGYSTLWIGILFVWSRRAFSRHMLASGGGD